MPTDQATFISTGRPTPTVRWLVNGEAKSGEEMQEPGDVTKVTLRVPKLGRRHLHAVFECMATNFNDSSPISSTVTLDMNCEYELWFVWLTLDMTHFIYELRKLGLE